MLGLLSKAAVSWPQTGWRRASRSRALAVASLTLIVLLLVVRESVAAGRFWLSPSSVLPTSYVPTTQPSTVLAANGSDVLMYIWFQPDTGKMLRNFSLNLVTTDPSNVSFPSGPGSDLVYNGPAYQTTNRFQFVFDSDHGMSMNDADGVRGIQGFIVNTSGNLYTGIGSASCAGGDVYCSTISNGPAWLVGSVKTHVDVSSGLANYYLQIGANGMNYLGPGETTGMMSVVFGADAITYNAGTDREVIKQFDLPDFKVQACSNGAGEYNNNCKVDAADYVLWRNNPGSYGGNPTGYTNWRANYGKVSGSGSGASGVVPEPTAGLLLLVGCLWTAIFRLITR